MGLKFANFAYSQLAVGISAVDVTVAVTGGHGSRFPTLAVGDYFYATIENASTQREIVKVTARSGDTFTVVRAQDNTLAQPWLAGDSIAIRFNAATAEGFQTQTSPTGSVVTPSGTTAQRDAIPQAALFRYNTTLAHFEGYTSGWYQVPLQSGLTGALAIPSGTTAQRSTALGVGIRRNTDTLSFEGYDGTNWTSLGGGATGAPGNPIFYENDQTVTGDYTLSGSKNAVTAGPITINTGVTVTISSGATWSVV